MRQFISGVVVALASEAAILALAWLFMLPRLDWGANQSTSAAETGIASGILARWVDRNANSGANPLAPTPGNLKSARAEYEEHCAACHGLDGSGRNQFEADFYPRVARLTGATQKLSDPEIYFIVANGIAFTAMPGFGKRHSSADIWRIILWVRHLPHLSAEERNAINRQMQGETKEHEKTMDR